MTTDSVFEFVTMDGDYTVAYQTHLNADGTMDTQDVMPAGVTDEDWYICLDCGDEGYHEAFHGPYERYVPCGCAVTDYLDAQYEDAQISAYEDRMADAEPPANWEP